MTARPRDYFSLRLSAFYITLGTTTGVGMPFFPAFLEYKGLTADEIGVVLAIPMLVRIVFVPLATRLADRLDVWRTAMLVGSIGGVLGNALIAGVDGFVATILAVAVGALFFTPLYPLADAYALRGLAERSRAYGPVRMWSSVAFIVANIGSGYVVQVVGRSSIVWMIVAAYAVGVVLSVLLVPATPHHEIKVARAAPGKSMWRSPIFIAVIIACSLIQSSHAVFYGFSTLDWTGKGLSDTVVGLLWATAVITEVILFAFVARFPIGPFGLLVLGGSGALVRWVVMAFDPPFALLPMLQCLHALSFGATHIGAMQFISRVAPPGQGATAQGDFAAAQALVFAGAMSGSGVLFRAYGDLAYAVMALLAAVGLCAAIVARVMRTGERGL